MLVDSGITNNFIDLSLAKKLGLSLSLVKKMSVAVANGFKIQVQFCCQQVSWKVQGTTFVSDFLAMPIGGYGVVLGIQWLPHWFTFKAIIMSIQCHSSGMIS